MIEIDPLYTNDKYRHFSFFDFKFSEDPDAKGKKVKLEAHIIESTMRGDQGETKDTRPTTKRAFKLLKIYFGDTFRKADIEMDLGKFKFESALQIGALTPIHDGHVVDSVSIDLPAKALEALRRAKRDKVTAVFYDKAGKVVSVSEVDLPDLNK